MIVTAGNRSVVAVMHEGRIRAIVLVPAHELERMAPAPPPGTTLESATPFVCDTAEELQELLGSLDPVQDTAR